MLGGTQVIAIGNPNLITGKHWVATATQCLYQRSQLLATVEDDGSTNAVML
jgi:hypothetical protein